MKTKRFIVNARVLIISIVTVILIGFAGISDAGLNLWTSNGPEGGYVSSFLIDPVSPLTIYAGTYGGVLKAITEGTPGMN